MKKGFPLLVFLLFIAYPCLLRAQTPDTSGTAGARERAYCIEALTRIADPVLEALSKNELREKMPVQSVAGKEKERQHFTYLEAFGRLLAGMAPWLELGPDATPEGRLREKYIRLALTCIHNATDPRSPDFMNFNQGSQPVVDAAFLAQALLRAPRQLWGRLDAATRKNVIAALKSSRVITPYYSNWLLFSAEIEAALLKFDGHGDEMRIDYAVKQHLLWYKGDGVYGDGPHFHWDYYNSFVIQPMLLEVLHTLEAAGRHVKGTYDQALTRARRYAAIQERLISPEGTYPPIGRSLAYRFGAFQVLAKMALLHTLPENVTPQQVRAALYTVIRKQLEAPGTFDAHGWLRIGFYGDQPGVGEGYISTGSLYLCSEGLITLGLPADDPFWTGADKEWTARKAWEGKAFPIDHAIGD